MKTLILKIGWGAEVHKYQVSSTTHLVDIIDFRTKGPLMTRDFLQQKYIEERLSMSQIARMLVSSPSTVHKYIKLYGLPVRKGADCHLPLKGYGLAYGKKVQHRRIITHQREQETIGRMQELRAKGFSYTKIAEALNALGVPTKTGRGKWQIKTVHTILGKV